MLWPCWRGGCPSSTPPSRRVRAGLEQERVRRGEPRGGEPRRGEPRGVESSDEVVSLSVLPVFDRLLKEIVVVPDPMFVLGNFLLSGAALVGVLGRGGGRDLSRVRTGWLEWNRDSLRLVLALSCIPARPYPSAENGGAF